MFLAIAFALLFLNVAFLIVKMVAPYSELMNSFKTVNGYWIAQAACFVFVLLFVYLHFSGEEQAKWHISPEYVTEGDLYLGDESGSIEYNSFIVEGKNYETNVILPPKAIDADKVRLLFTHEGTSKLEPKAISRPTTKEQPVTLWFPESGKWRIDFEVDGSVVSSVVIPVKEKKE
ncbi:hypothetical protein LCM10_03445 [Rossellomorea aquimaris]|uniref:hypothetical protein n=1 Tax=Rossellomorea aquimaris TaxID=189382 RepID=UPI001CD2CE04|nr:hypothetical protein [Rossellomorea aquimaris]MCA1054031.1 hypothetical protein [Rossellomorea aquimaris]